MRVAISFSGLPRMVPIALQSWQWLKDRYNADVYIHTWDVGDSTAQSLCRTFEAKACCIEKPREFKCVSDYTERLFNSSPLSVFSMWTSIWESMNLVNRRGQDYDIVVRARFDVAFDPFEFMHCRGVVVPGKPAEIYEFQGLRYPGWHDMMAYGDLTSMMVYANTIDSIPLIYSEVSPFYSEFFLSTHLFRTGTNVTHHQTPADIVR